MIKSNNSNNSIFDSNLTSLSSSELSSICGGDGLPPWEMPPYDPILGGIGGIVGGPIGSVIGGYAGSATVIIAGFIDAKLKGY